MFGGFNAPLIENREFILGRLDFVLTDIFDAGLDCFFDLGRLGKFGDADQSYFVRVTVQSSANSSDLCSNLSYIVRNHCGKIAQMILRVKDEEDLNYFDTNHLVYIHEMLRNNQCKTILSKWTKWS